MKKITKGAIASSAAVALLLGGSFTLAYWNDSLPVGGNAVISAGNLALKQSAAPTWTIKHTSGAETPVTDISAVRIVPGDKLVFTGGYAVTAQGDNLVVKVDIAANSIAPADSGNAADVKLASRLTKTATYTINGTAGNTGKISHRSATSKDYPLTVSVSLDWAFGNTGSPTDDNPAKTGKVNLSDFAVTATQQDGTTN